MAASSLQAVKQVLRKRIRGALASMSEQQRREESQELVRKLLLTDEYKSSSRVSVYLSMSNEVQTEGILKDVFSSGRMCYIPWYDTGSTRMEMLRVTSLEEIAALPLTKWNIRQHRSPDAAENALSSGGLDLIVSPGLGFNKEGHRLGQGKGYYDTYLARCHDQGLSPLTIGMAYRCMACEEVPMSEHDSPMDKVLFVS
ncbi:5-formyltetrahydrofolate cyclo-ligase-like [Halichondria panicea]|uniref:5-formyltetrahydrofolate cyclo-ligase-like n=1 Tax=Halichondria panicea TaxID=6063 RepID=UPI00312B9847